MNLSELKINEHARVLSVGTRGSLRQHLLDMGVLPGVEMTLMRIAPMGDPLEFRVRNYELTMRLEDCKCIEAERIEQLSDRGRECFSAVEHPGLGQSGLYHNHKNAKPWGADEVLNFVLVGNQNCGKTTLFNALTGSSQHVGNFPGVTVDHKTGVIIGHDNTQITDLPGIYSMSPYSPEEIVSRDFVLSTNPKGIINIVDATNIERNLYLTMQLLEMNIPMVVALNMMDEVAANGGYVDVNGLEALLGVPVVPISAAKGQGIDELLEHALHVARYNEKPVYVDFCRDSAVHRCLHAVIHLIEDHCQKAGLPWRFAASKLIEGDELIKERLDLDENELELLEHIVKQMEIESGYDKDVAMAKMRYDFIDGLSRKCVVAGKRDVAHSFSTKLDKVLCGKYSAIPVFVGIMGLIFYLTFNVIGAYLQGLLEALVGYCTVAVDGLLTSLSINMVLHKLIIEGIFNGVGSVLSFLPVIVTLFFFLSLLEDSGYIARVAFVMDRTLRRIGLSGRSIVPLLIGFGCTVPAVMSTRTLPSERDRKLTILLTPFMSCSAKLPIYGFFVAAFFREYQALVMLGLYLLGIASSIVVAYFYRSTLFKGEAVPFVMELPNYRFPTLKNVGLLLWEKAEDFLHKAFSIIMVATIVIWFLQSFDLHCNYVTDQSLSILSGISGGVAFVLRPLGLDDWRIVTSLISGVIAKESVVSTIELLFADGLKAALTPLMAASLLTFSLLYTPCVAAIATIRRELGTLAAVWVVVFQCSFAYMMAFIVKVLLSGVL